MPSYDETVRNLIYFYFIARVGFKQHCIFLIIQLSHIYMHTHVQIKTPFEFRDSLV